MPAKRAFSEDEGGSHGTGRMQGMWREGFDGRRRLSSLRSKELLSASLGHAADVPDALVQHWSDALPHVQRWMDLSGRVHAANAQCANLWANYGLEEVA